MMNKEKIKFAVVGAGHIGKRHAEMIQRDAEAELVAMCDVRSMEACDSATYACLLYTSPSPRDRQRSRMPSSA